MPYVYLLQPAEYANTNRYKIGISSACNLNRLKSYGRGTEYIRYFQCVNYKEAESELIKELNNSDKSTLFRGREYFYGHKADILEIFTNVMNKYTKIELDEMKRVSDSATEINQNSTREEQKVKYVNTQKPSSTIRSEIKNNTKMFSCEQCKFSCSFKCDYVRHLKTKKHVQNLEINNSCAGCLKVFSNKSNKTRHEKTCDKYLSIQSKDNIAVQTNQPVQTIQTVQLSISSLENNINSYEMTFKQLKSKKTTDCFKKVILSCMEDQKSDIMDLIDKFDNMIDNEVEEHILSEETISRYIAEVLLESNLYVVTHIVTHLDGRHTLLFKHLNALHNDNILLAFIQRSKRQDRLNMSKDFKPVSVLKRRYPEFYKKLEKDALGYINRYNSSVQLNSSSAFSR